jgi:RNAse (barnase) inhibitor barstar
VEIIEIDGTQFATLEEFFSHFGERALTAPWGKNLDAFNDVLRGGFGTPNSFVLRWKNHAVSRQRLGHEETARQLELKLVRCHPANRAAVAQDLEVAKLHQGPTVFDWLVEIIRVHGLDGSESEDQVHLELV